MIDKKVLSTAQDAFISARVGLVQSNKLFWVHLVLKMPLQWLEDVPGGISCTDGESMFINPEGFLKLSKDERTVVLIHEAGHCAAGHLTRCGSRDPQLFNLAGDIYLANMMEAEGLHNIQLQEDMFTQIGIDKAEFKDMCTEEIYAKLPQKAKKAMGQGQGQGKGKGKPQPGGCGHGHWQPGGCYKAPSAARKAELDAQWRQNVLEAGQVAGSAPGAWSELVKAAMPKPPFHIKLFDYLNRGIGGETDWGYLNRRYIHSGMYIPTDTHEVMGEIAIAVDTSGSMSSEQLKLAFGYIRSFRDSHPCKLHLTQCDHDCIDKAQYKVYEEYETLPSEFKAVGRGGTSFSPPFKLLKDKNIEPKVLIYFTDAHGSCDAPKPAYPVLWVIIHGDAKWKAPFGEVVTVS